MTFIFAHTGHWITSLIYAAPVVLLVALLVADHMRNRRREKAKVSSAAGPVEAQAEPTRDQKPHNPA
ncbi:MAG: hypothetical protein WCK06_00350 [Actinomycetota bacterium]